MTGYRGKWYAAGAGLGAIAVVLSAVVAIQGPLRERRRRRELAIEGNAEATVREMLAYLAEESPPFAEASDCGLEPDWVSKRGDVLAEAGAQRIPELIDALRRPEPQIRARVAQALGEIGPAAKEAIPLLARAAGDPDIRVANAGIRALRKLGPEGRAALNRALPPSGGGSAR